MKTKRKRIEQPNYTKSVYRRIQEKRVELGITYNKFEDKWAAICNEVRMMNLAA